ncbi:MAG: excinuclease ABC subunit B [Candidatus Marinimicrobia bacterium]|nr:excinuclease ABC subunit B [Candidatus Neomarinimicrobiota bacterium]|tara:strand:+ start:8488 stop:10479 length:1992 start_codon:yes stop_codon:yes gene_type:complete
MAEFRIQSPFSPTADQNRAVMELMKGFNRSEKWQTLLGVTGSGKTFTMANLIQNLQKPTLVISHNKTLAAQLYGEFKKLFPENGVEYFISYYDYYQPEAYLPVTDTFIEKDSSVNEEIDKLRLKATESLLTRGDVIVVSSVSCIYGIGSPEDYQNKVVQIKVGQKIDSRQLYRSLVDIYYVRSDTVFERGRFRVRGDVVEIYPAYEDHGVRIELFGNEVEAIRFFNPLTGAITVTTDSLFIYPAKHFVTDESSLDKIIDSIREELAARLEELRGENKLLEAQRLEQRTNFDMEMMLEVGYCSGIENYSRYFSGRIEGQRPYTLLDYFPDDYLIFLDESHVTLPQIQGMYHGDRSRKEVLVEYGFRLPSALDNRPLKYDEFEDCVNQAVFVSATPSEREHAYTGGAIVEQIIRPTGLLDPIIHVRPSDGQIDDLIGNIRERVDRKERILVTTLTKRMSEDLTDYLMGMNLRVRYLHSEINSVERVKTLRDLRLGEFDVLVGINLLREGLDLPEVSLVAVLDADKEGFLRSERSLMQVAGRASRNVNGTVIFYADRVTNSMQKVIDESERRRKIQKNFNEEHEITPTTIYKSIDDVLISTSVADAVRETEEIEYRRKGDWFDTLDKGAALDMMKNEMLEAADNQEFEKAAKLRDEIEKLRKEFVA